MEYHKHGMSKHPLYETWKKMRFRCNNPNYHEYHLYGGRGIKVCQRWDDFALFVKDMGERPEGKTLDRINNDLGYSPDNCRWATLSEQNVNRRSSRPRIDYDSEYLSLKGLFA